MYNPKRLVVGAHGRRLWQTLFVSACVAGLALFAACGGEETPTGDDDTEPSEMHNLGGRWNFVGYDIEGGRFTCLRAGLALDLLSYITNFRGTVSGMGTACEDKLGRISWNLNIGPLGIDTIRGSLSNGKVRFEIPAHGARVSKVHWANEGTVVGDSLVGDLTILFTVSDGWTDSTRHSVTGKWKATRRQ